jgi:hypothetical protein
VTLRAPVASILGFKLTLGYADGVEDLQGEGKRFINMHFDNPARFVLEGNRNSDARPEGLTRQKLNALDLLGIIPATHCKPTLFVFHVGHIHLIIS